MGKISMGSGSLFLMSEDGEPMQIGDAIKIETINDCSEGDHEESLNHMHTSGEIEIDFRRWGWLYIKFYHRGYNVCRRMHGGFALRERTKYKWHKRHKKRKE